MPEALLNESMFLSPWWKNVLTPALDSEMPGVYNAAPSESTGAVAPAPSRRNALVPLGSVSPTLVSRRVYRIK